MTDAIHAVDLQLYRFINLRLTAFSLDPLMLTLSNGNLWIAIMGTAVLFAAWKRSVYALKILLLIAVSVALSDSASYYVFKPAFQRVRPCHRIMDARRVGGVCGSKFGLPSNHAANGMAATTVLALFASRSWFLAGLFFTVLVAYTRIYLSVHFPGDILAGFVVGIAAGLLVCLSAKGLRFGNDPARA